MPKDEIRQMMINDHLVGIIGLDKIIKKLWDIPGQERWWSQENFA